MPANRVRETSTSTGTGNITLAGAVANFRTFNAARGTNRPFTYWIVNGGGTGSEWETGEGYLSDATTLVRATPADGSAATPVNFTGGDLQVFIELNTQSTPRLPIADLTDLGANTAWMQSALVDGGGGAVGAPAADTIYYTQFDLEVGGEWTGLAQNVLTAGAAGEQALLGFYSVGSDGLPDRLLTDADLTIDIASTGEKESPFASAIDLEPGSFYVAFVSESGTAEFRGVSRSVMSKAGLLGIQSGNGRSLSSCSESYTGGWTTPTLPTTANATTVQTFETVPIGYLYK